MRRAALFFFAAFAVSVRAAPLLCGPRSITIWKTYEVRKEREREDGVKMEEP
jgi:hypothetical protein